MYNIGGLPISSQVQEGKGVVGSSILGPVPLNLKRLFN